MLTLKLTFYNKDPLEASLSSIFQVEDFKEYDAKAADIKKSAILGICAKNNWSLDFFKGLGYNTYRIERSDAQMFEVGTW